MQLAGFDWDEGNIEHCQKHGLRIDEIEAVLSGTFRVAPDPRHSGSEQRFIAIGRTEAGRAVFIAYTHRIIHGKWYLRPISARYMHAKEIKAYDA